MGILSICGSWRSFGAAMIALAAYGWASIIFFFSGIHAWGFWRVAKTDNARKETMLRRFADCIGCLCVMIIALQAGDRFIRRAKQEMRLIAQALDRH